MDKTIRHQILNNIHLGDIVEIFNRSENCVIKKGYYEYKVVQEDEKSFALGGIDLWWFYRSNGESYVGDAIVVDVIKATEQTGAGDCSGEDPRIP